MLGDASHAWLEIDGLVVDITADQFEEISDKVLIQSPDIWHSKYQIQNKRQAGYSHFTGPAVADLMSVHGKILETLEK